MGSIRAVDVLMDVAYALLEQPVETTLGTSIVAGTRTVTPGSMRGIYAGAKLVVGPVASIEQITVSSITSTTFTATFANDHSDTDRLYGATFPNGQDDHELFSQDEMLGYLVDVESDFLLKTEVVMNSHSVAATTNEATHSRASSAIKVIRVAFDGVTLSPTTMKDLDLLQPGLTVASGTPRYWYQDNLPSTVFGMAKIPDSDDTVSQYFVQGVTPGGMTLVSSLTVPDPLSMYLKYGVLARAWSKTGDSADPRRAEYCQKRFEFGVLLVARFIMGLQAHGTREARPVPKYNPLAVADA